MPSFIGLFLFACLHYHELSELLLVGLCKERADARSEGSSYKNKVKTYKRFLRTIHSSPALPTLQWEMRKQVVLLWVFRNKLRYQSWTEQLFNLVTLHASYAAITSGKKEIFSLTSSGLEDILTAWIQKTPANEQEHTFISLRLVSKDSFSWGKLCYTSTWQ